MNKTKPFIPTWLKILISFFVLFIIVLVLRKSSDNGQAIINWSNYDKSVKLRIDSLISNKDCNALQNELLSEKYSRRKLRYTKEGKKRLQLLNYIYFEMKVINCDLGQSENVISWLDLRKDSIELKKDSLNFAANKKKLKVEEDKFKKTKAGKIYLKHPNWSMEDCERLSKKQIWIGMEYEMLVYLRGRPNHVNTSNYGKGEEYQACWDNYDPGCFYFDETQIIKSYN
jgi:hypothetical protein